MNARDLLFMARCAVDDLEGRAYTTTPEKGEAAAAERLRKKGLVIRDMTRTIKPYKYVLTDSGLGMIPVLLKELELDWRLRGTDV